MRSSFDHSSTKPARCRWRLAQTAYKEYDDQHQWRDAFGGAERKILGNGPAVRSASLLERRGFEPPVSSD